MLKNKIQPHLYLFSLILLLSFPISLLLFIGKIDPDFFTFYYIGRGLNTGLDLFKDFVDNKGPLNYYFFALLYKIFGNNYRLAVFSSNWFIDSASIFFLVLIIRKWISRFEINLKTIPVLFLTIFFYKSFSISTFMGGVYSETLGMFFILMSLYLLTEGKNIFSGILFACAVLTRQTELYFVFIYLLWFLRDKKIKGIFQWAISGVFFTALIIGYYLYKDGSFVFLVDNTILMNLGKVGTSLGNPLVNFILFSLIDFRIIISLIFFLITGIFVITTSRKRVGIFIIVLMLSFFLATFLQTSFYPHHMTQIAPLIILILFWGKKNNFFLSKTFIAIIAISCLFSYIYYCFSDRVSLRELDVNKHFSSINIKTYLQVITYYPELYFYFKKTSPDRYFQYFESTSKYSWKYQLEHRAIPPEKLRNTTFLFINGSRRDQLIIDDYKSSFLTPFSLEKINTVQIGNYEIEIYESKI